MLMTRFKFEDISSTSSLILSSIIYTRDYAAALAASVPNWCLGLASPGPRGGTLQGAGRELKYPADGAVNVFLRRLHRKRDVLGRVRAKKGIIDESPEKMTQGHSRQDI